VRRHVIANFTFERRERELVDLLLQLVRGRRSLAGYGSTGSK
jgi:hypothetical protein